MLSKNAVTRNLTNILGPFSGSKRVVIESDDWGSIRMPSLEVFNKLMAYGIPVYNDPFNRYDSIATESDLTNLFEILTSVKDKNGNPAILTANTIVANPDFTKIKNSEYTQYHFEPFTQTLEKYPGCSNSFNLWKDGISNNIFRPQLHGREHLNVNSWLKSLRSGDKNLLYAFDNNVFGINFKQNSQKKNNFMAALDFDSSQEEAFNLLSIKEGSEMFSEKMGYKSKTFIAPCYIWNDNVEAVLKSIGVELIQGVKFQFIPSSGDRYLRKYHYHGQKSIYGQRYIVRNAYFEPSINEKIDWVDDCLNRISCAFRWGKPAIIESHRLNFIGAINLKNRDKNLALLRLLLKSIIKKWPDIEFCSSDRLF